MGEGVVTNDLCIIHTKLKKKQDKRSIQINISYFSTGTGYRHSLEASPMSSNQCCHGEQFFFFFFFFFGGGGGGGGRHFSCAIEYSGLIFSPRKC